MTVRVAINGFGRIGRHILRAIAESGRSDIEVVGINDLAPLESLSYLFKYDTVHGKFPGSISVEDNHLVVNGQRIKVTQERNPADLPWATTGVDIAMECTGLFRDRENAQKHIDAGAAKVLISAPGSDVDRTIVYGVNHDELTPDDKIVSNASCTTNCLAPVATVLDDAIGIKHGFMTTVHSYTSTQNIVDSHHKKDLHRARAAAENIIPTTTGAAKAVGLVLPELDGKLDGVAIRVPTPNVSLIDLTFVPKNATDADAVNDALSTAAAGRLNGVLGVTHEPLVSSDFIHDPRSSVADLNETNVMGDGQFVRVLSWYDNEWGFANRMADTAIKMAEIG